MSITVAELCETLRNVLEELEGYSDDSRVKTVSNTYFLDSDYFIAMGSDGYVDMHNIHIDEDFE